MKLLEIGELLPLLDERTKDVDSWAENFIRLMKLANINDHASIHSWAMECVEGKLRGVLQDLVTQDEQGNKQYPSIHQMKEALEEAMVVTPQIKCKRLQKLKIQKNESIKNFNWRYKKLYNNLPETFQDFITVEDYAESILYRPYARAQVITKQCTTLEQAFEEAELAERAENISYNAAGNETVMATIYEQYNYSPFNKGKHPFKLFGSNSITRSTRRSDSNKTTQQSNKGNPSKKTITCFRCNRSGHYIKECPYSFKELAQMEEEEEEKLKANHESLNY